LSICWFVYLVCVIPTFALRNEIKFFVMLSEWRSPLWQQAPSRAQAFYLRFIIFSRFKEFEIISGQHMELEIDLDITLEYLHLNDIVTLWL